VLTASEAKRLEALENEMGEANNEYLQAVNRAKALHGQITEMLNIMLSEQDFAQDNIEHG